MKSIYELKRFKSSNARDLSKALKIYSENIEPAYRTDTNEILYWIDNFNKNSDDSFYVFGFYLDDILIGFAELAYFKTEKLIVVDYLVIDIPFRGMNTFYELIHRLKVFLLEEGLAVDYVIGEVGCFFENEAPPESSQNLIRLLKMVKFGVVKTKHYVPRLGLKNFESEMMAILMIYTPDGIKKIKKETYFAIIKTLYHKYYRKWYEPFLKENEMTEYNSILNRLFTEITDFASGKQIIEINGSFNLWEMDIKYMKQASNHQRSKIILIGLIFILSMVILGLVGIFIQKKIGIDIDGQASVILFSITLTAIIIGALFQSKSSFWSNLFQSISDKL
jgi:hypothetical protein